MRYATVCSGIDAPALAWDPLGWQQVFASEIEPFPSAVLAHHKPDVPNYGDMTKYKEWPYETNIDVLCGGTPCQSFSIAGLRQGLDDPRGNLALTFIGLVERYRPGWVLWENVAGVLSSNNGQDFEAFIRGMAEIGYFGAWRVLDAQWFGVAQRRRRVFAVFCPGDWRPAAAVLFEPESLQGNPAPSRETRERVAPSVTTGAPFSRTSNERTEAEAVISVAQNQHGEVRSSDVIPSLGAGGGKPGEGYPCIAIQTANTGANGSNLNDQTARNGHIIPVTAARMTAFGEYVDDGTASTMKQRDYKDATDLVVYGFQPRIARNDRGDMGDVCHSISAQSGQTGRGDAAPCVAIHGQHMAVRRLTPTECERLQGFTSGYTQIPYRNKAPENCPDGPRYKALGNSMAVPVIKWIGERIQTFESIRDLIKEDEKS